MGKAEKNEEVSMEIEQNIDIESENLEAYEFAKPLANPKLLKRLIKLAKKGII